MSAALGGGQPPNILPAAAGAQPVIHVNVEQNLIYVGEAQVRLCLTEHLGRMRNANEWQTPLAILIAVTLSIVTSTFHDFVFPAATWQAIFVIVGAGSFICLIRAFIRAAQVHTSIDEIVAQIKRESAAGHRKAPSRPEPKMRWWKRLFTNDP